jgi:hypothetical protein
MGKKPARAQDPDDDDDAALAAAIAASQGGVAEVWEGEDGIFFLFEYIFF